MDETIEKAKAFHGHLCAGVTIGVRAAEIALREIGPHSTDEEVVAIVETDMCAVDAIQLLTGCTFGKGNLIHRDYGKNAFTFIRRSDGKAIRIVSRPDAWPADLPERQMLATKISAGTASDVDRRRYWELVEERALAVLDILPERMFEVREVHVEIPRRARVQASIACEQCDELTMETRIRRYQGRNLCIPCFEQANMQ